MANTILNAPTIPAPGGTGVWSLLSSPAGCATTPVITTPNSPTTTVSNLLCAGIYQFQYCITNPGCSVQCSTMLITVDCQPVCNTGPVQEYNGLTLLALGAYPLNCTGSSGLWTQVSGPGTSSFANAALPNTSVTVSTYGTYVYQWTITLAGGSTCSGCNVQTSAIFVAPQNGNFLSINNVSGTLATANAISVTNNAVMVPPFANNSLSFGMWIMPTQANVSTILYKASVNSIQIQVTNTNAIRVKLNGVIKITTASSTVTMGQWNQVHFTHDGTTFNVWVNATLIGSFAESGFPYLTGNAGNLIFAGDGVIATDGFRGFIANLVWAPGYLFSQNFLALDYQNNYPGRLNSIANDPNMFVNIVSKPGGGPWANDVNLVQSAGPTVISGSIINVTGTPTTPYAYVAQNYYNPYQE